jgi:hypothetical protein
MLALKMVKVIEKHSDELAEGLLCRLQGSRNCSDMRKVPPDELRRRSYEIYRNLGDWLLNKTENDIDIVFTELARRRASQGVALSHLLWALLITKEHLWEFMQSERLADQVLELFGELELLWRVDHFFDRALHSSAKAYEEHALRPVSALAAAG